MLTARPRRAMLEDGFTLIELVVVVLVITILASLALPALLGQREKAHDVKAKSNIANLVRHMQACRFDLGTYDGCQTQLTTATTGLPIGSEQGQVHVVGNPTMDDYVIEAVSLTRTFRLTHTATGDVRSCAPSGGGCNGTSW